MIEHYEFGRIVINGQEYQKDVFIGLKGVFEWKRSQGHAVYTEDVKKAIKDKPEIVILGNGADSIMSVSQEVHDFFQNEKISLIVKDSATACEEYNRLKKEGRGVVAFFHLTC